MTSARRPGTPAAERKRQQRARDNAALLFERDDWLLFVDPATLSQKAGCQTEDLRQPVETSGDWTARAETLAAHGASMTEIRFLRHRRVELNAMPADVFVQFLERKLAEHGISTVVPGNDVLEQHAQHVLTRALTNKALEAIRAKAEEDAHSIALSSDLHGQVVAALKRQPEIPWDFAVADIVCKVLDKEGTL